MSGHVIMILVLVVGGVILVGLVLQLLEGTSAEWKTLAGRYPAQSPGPDAERGEARIRMGVDPDRLWARGCLWFLMPWTWTRGLRQVRYAVDDEYLHLETEGGRFAPRSAISIPWAEIDVEGRVQTHMGEHAMLRVGEVVIAMPSETISRELGIREELETASEGDTTQRGGGDGDLRCKL